MVLQFYLKYYSIDSEGGFNEDLNTQINVIDSNITLNTDSAGNSCVVRFNNPIIDYFSDGSPRRKFVGETGASVFKSGQTSTGYDSFEERIEIYVIDSEDINGTADNEDYLIFSGQIKELKGIHEKEDCSIKLTLSDRTYNLLNRIFSNSYSDQTNHEIIQDIIRQRTEDNSAPQRGEGYDTSGVKGNGPYLIDARTFTEGIKTSSETIATMSNKTLTCTGATFITDGVNSGDLIKNETNYQLARVKTVLSETEITITKDIFAVGDSIKISDGFMQDWRPNGTPFPKISSGETSTPVVDWIDNLVQTDSTNSALELMDANGYIVNQAMRYYVDGRNRFHCFIPDTSPSAYIEMGQTSPVGTDIVNYKTYSCEMKKGVYGSVNFIIFNAGEDMNDNSYTGYAQDASQGGPNVTDCSREYPKVSQNMKIEEARVGNIILSSSTSYAFPVSYNPLPNGNSYPEWDSTRDSIPTSDTDYNLLFRQEGRIRAKRKAYGEIYGSSTPTWSGKCEVGFFNFAPSDLVDFTDLDLGVSNQQLRIKSVQHNLGKGGFFTTLTLIEDSTESS